MKANEEITLLKYGKFLESDVAEVEKKLHR
jgi:hypothetical protein